MKEVESFAMETALLILLPLISAGAGAYFGSYLKKKGENLATHEDIDKLVDQLRVVTQTTKEIEARISNDVWERQQRSQAKREALFEAVKYLADAQSALTTLYIAYTQKAGSEAQAGLVRKMRSDATQTHLSIGRDFCRARNLAFLYCSYELSCQFTTLDGDLNKVAGMIVSEDIGSMTMLRALTLEILDLLVSIRRELGVEPFMSQSSESSAVQAPAPPAPK